METSNARKDLVFDVTAASFQKEVLERSRQVPVVVDFWAAWCGPCRMLGPVLEQAVEQLGGRVLLGKIDTDQEPALAAEYRISGIPQVIAFKGGQVVDEFTGARDPRFVRAFLERLAPSPETQALEEAGELLRAGEPRKAEALLRPLTRDADKAPPLAVLRLAEALLVQGPEHFAEVPGLLDRLDSRSREAELAERLRQLLDFYRCAGGKDVAASRAGRAARPEDLDARYALAAALALAGEHREALEELLAIVGASRRYREDGARRAMLLLFDHLGPDNELTQEYRRRLQVLL